MDARGYQALVRFGLGRRAGESIPADPPAWLADQLKGPDPAQFKTVLPSTADGLTLLREQNKLKLPPGVSLVRPVLEQDIKAQTTEALETAAPFRERLVWFWANHFTVSIRQGGTAATIGPYIREAIRPNVTGPFFAMLLAVMRHPAMLMYLDNGASIGPGSPAGQRQQRGLNENLARECLELHTVSPASGYAQKDVTEFAKVLTGWSVEQNRTEPGFVFRDNAHEPGPKTVLGRSFPPGETGGILALDFLANHPATHRHLALKLVRHFVADDPPVDAVRTVEGVLRDTQGDLGAAAAAVTRLPAAWQPLAKLRSSQEFVIAALRALDLPDDKRPAPQAMMAALGQPLWNAPLPNGWSDTAAEWAAPEAMMRRIDWGYALAGRVADQDPAAVAEAGLGPLLPAGTLEQIRHAGSRRDGMTLFLTSPQFQRR